MIHSISALLLAGPLALHAAPIPAPPMVCMSPPCFATSAVVCSIESRCVPSNAGAPITLSLQVSVYNASSDCGGGSSLTIHPSFTETDAFADASSINLTGIPSALFTLTPSSAISGMLDITFPAGAPVGARTFDFTLTGPAFPTRTCTARIDISSTICVQDMNGNVCALGGEATSKRFRIDNLTAVARNVSFTVTSTQTSSSAGTGDHFPIEFCALPLPPGSTGNPVPPTIGSSVTVPASGFAEVCINTRSYPACHGGSNCKYDLLAVDMATGNQVFASSGLTVVTLTWNGCAAALNGPGVTFCFGDGVNTAVTTPCPCNNFGALGNGCANSGSPGGAGLTSMGSTSPDSVTLVASGMTGTCVFLKGDAVTPSAVTFGDGLRCADGALIRMGTLTVLGGSATYPGPGNASVSVRGATPPGSGLSGFYQTYYRNAAAAFCPPFTFNATNALNINW